MQRDTELKHAMKLYVLEGTERRFKELLQLLGPKWGHIKDAENLFKATGSYHGFYEENPFLKSKKIL